MIFRMIPPAYPCGASTYVQKIIKICEWVKNKMSALNLLCTDKEINDFSSNYK